MYKREPMSRENEPSRSRDAELFGMQSDISANMYIDGKSSSPKIHHVPV